jgi:hypothetical protein
MLHKMKQRTVENMKTKYHSKHGKRKNSLSHVKPKLLQGFSLWWCSIIDTDKSTTEGNFQ